jgi:hypothetical protein
MLSQIRIKLAVMTVALLLLLDTVGVIHFAVENTLGE